MKRSLLALLLALVMCLSLFCVSCSSGKDGEEEEDPNVLEQDVEVTPMTITLYAPTKSTTTQEQIKVVEDAFNEITESKYNTHVVLKLIPEDEYDQAIQDNVKKITEQIEAEWENPSTEAPETEAPAAEENGEEMEVKYPEAKENQMDLFLVHSFDTYYKLATSGFLNPLDSDLNATGKLLSSYVYPYLLRAAKVEGYTYGVFNNTVFGNYQYLLLNKELVDKYEYDPEEIKNISSISMFLQEIKKNEPDVIPFIGEFEAPVVYWNNQPSVIGAFVGDAMSSAGKVDATSYRPEALYPGSLFNSSAYRAWMTEYNKLYQADCIVAKTAENENSKFAATIIEGDVTLSPTFADVYGNYKTDEYGFKYITDENGVDYYVSVYKRPMADNKTVFNAGYVMNAYTEDPARCMEILTCLNTDAALSNLFMYGVKDKHYTIDEVTKLVHKTTDTYAMDISTIGNIYLLNPSDDMNEYWQFMSKNNWENAKNTNREAIMNPFLGFYFNPEKPLEEDLTETQIMPELSFAEHYQEVVKASEPYLTGVLTFRDTEDYDFNRYIMAQRNLVGEDPLFDQLTDYNTGVYYMLSPYNTWYQEHYGVTLGLG